MLTVIVKEDRGYKWTCSKDIYFKGYVIDPLSGNVLRDEEAISFFDDIHSEEQLKTLLNQITGLFALIINKLEFKCAAVDISRSIPIFFNERGDVCSDSAEEIRLKDGLSRDAIDDFYLTSMMAKTYVMGNSTAYESIKQLDLGQYVVFNEKTPVIGTYFYHLNKVIDRSPLDIKLKLTEIVYQSFERLKKVINGRPVVLSMSGGYDSRFIGCMLKNVGITNVKCFSYGKRGSFEIEQSRKNAEALGFDWICIEHSDELVKKLVDKEGIDYLDSYSSHDYSAYYQNYPSVRELHEKGWFGSDSVIITGLCGDMPTGEYTVREESDKEYSVNTAADFLYKLMYDRFELDGAYKDRTIEILKKKLESLPIEIKDYQSWITATDSVFTGSIHVHAYMRMNHVHDYFGYEWLMPYWDKELLLFWYSIPAKYRLNQSLYEEWLMNDICKPYGIDIKKTVVGYSSNSLKKKLTYLGGTILSCICLNLGVPFKRRYDFNNWAPLELELYKRLENKKMISYRKASITNLIARYCFQRRYGSEVVVKAQSHLK